MDVKEVEFGMEDVISSLLNVIAYIISPILFIWAVNTLFNCGIPINFKTWLAGLVLAMLMKFHLRGTGSGSYPYYQDYPYDEEYDDYDEEDYYDEDDDYDDPDERKAKLKAKLIAYNDHKNKKNPPTDNLK